MTRSVSRSVEVSSVVMFFFFQAEDGIRDVAVTGVQTCALPIFERHKASQFFYGAGHGRQGLPDFMGDGGGETPQRGHALFGGHLLLQPAQVRKVLKVEDKAAAFLGSQAQRGHADSQIARLALWSPKM